MKRINQLIILIILVSVVCLAACTPDGTEPGAARETEVESGTQPPRVSPVMPFGDPEVRDLQPTIEVVSNCGGVTQPVVKHPSITVGSSHSVEWEVGGTVGVGLQIGSDLAPAKVDLNAALEGSVSRDLTNSIQQGNAWDLPAEPGYIMEYTIMWREVWQPGYIDVTFLAPEPEILRIDVKYRTGVQSEIVGQNATRCDSGSEVTVTQAIATTRPPDEPQPVQSLEQVPIRDHTPFSAGDGVFANVTVSDGQADFSSFELDTNHQHIQGIRREEQPDGCDEANHASDHIWVTGTPGMTLNVNGQEVGTYRIAPDFHGYMLDFSVNVGDQLCAVNFGAEGFSIIFGPDVYYHYDSYCHRFGC